MNPGDLPNSQLLILMAMFIGMALVFVGLLAFVFTGGFSGRGKKSKKRDRAVKFNLDANATEQDLVAVETKTDKIEPVSTTQVGQTTMTERKKGLLKSGGPAKTSNHQTPTPASEFANLFENSTASTAPEPNLINSEPNHTAANGQYREVLKVLVNVETGQTVVALEGVQYEDISQVEDKAIGHRILEVIALLLKFSGGLMATIHGIKSVPTPEAKLTAIPGAMDTAPKLQQRLAQVSNQTDFTPVAKSEVDSPPATPIENPKPMPKLERIEPIITMTDPSSTMPVPTRRGIFGRGRKTTTPELPPFNLASEIDNVVQQQLAAQLINIPVKIGTGRDGLLRIDVAGQVFDMVDEVEPADIREIIQTAIRNWEQR